jgi:hypothetical protein
VTLEPELGHFIEKGSIVDNLNHREQLPFFTTHMNAIKNVSWRRIFGESDSKWSYVYISAGKIIETFVFKKDPVFFTENYQKSYQNIDSRSPHTF